MSVDTEKRVLRLIEQVKTRISIVFHLCTKQRTLQGELRYREVPLSGSIVGWRPIDAWLVRAQLR
jgi:hypothetical protein